MTKQSIIEFDGSEIATTVLAPLDTLVCLGESAGLVFPAFSESRITNHESRH